MRIRATAAIVSYGSPAPVGSSRQGHVVGSSHRALNEQILLPNRSPTGVIQYSFVPVIKVKGTINYLDLIHYTV